MGLVHRDVVAQTHSESIQDHSLPVCMSLCAPSYWQQAVDLGAEVSSLSMASGRVPAATRASRSRSANMEHRH
jgi:hypothetical protein